VHKIRKHLIEVAETKSILQHTPAGGRRRKAIPPKHRMAAAVLLLGRRPISAGLSQLLWRAIKGNRFLIFFFESHFSESLRYHIGSQAYLIFPKRRQKK